MCSFSLLIVQKIEIEQNKKMKQRPLRITSDYFMNPFSIFSPLFSSLDFIRRISFLSQKTLFDSIFIDIKRGIYIQYIIRLDRNGHFFPPIISVRLNQLNASD